MPTGTESTSSQAPRPRIPRRPLLRVADAQQRIPRDDSGSATVEFLALSLVLLIPLIYLMLVVSQVQAAAFAAVATADQAAKVLVSGTEGVSPAQAFGSARMTMTDYGITADRYKLEIRCDDGDCMTRGPGEVVEVRVQVDVPPPLISAVWTDASLISVGSDARARMPRF